MAARRVVKDAVRSWRKVHAQTYVPLSHPPGEAQVDFGEASFYLDGVLTKAALFVMSLPYSDVVFIRAYPRECTESFQDGHVQAFAFFGGVPIRISYDNSRIAVKKFVGPRQRELTDGFLRLQSHYLFKEHFCLVRKANEKGHVENLVGYTRRNFLVPLPSVRSFDELNDLLDQGCLAELTRQLRGKDGTKGQRLDGERTYFRDLPRAEFAACRVELRQANTLSLVRFDRNDYSVPVRWAHHQVTVIGDCQRVRLMCRDEVVATHPRSWGREQVCYDPVHYLALLERRPGAVDFAAPLEQWDLPPCFGILRRKLEAEWPPAPGKRRRPKGYLNGTTQFIQVLRLLEHAALGELQTAVRKALGIEACSRGKKVRFFRVTELITQMMEAREERALARLKGQLAKLDLLILDELGYVPASKLGAELLFDVISAAYERTSILVTTNLPFERWVEVLGCERLTGATLDRLTHRCHVLEANGQSYRLNDAKRRRQSKPSK